VRCRVCDLVEVLSSCGLSVTDLDNSHVTTELTNESSDTVSSQLTSPHQVLTAVPGGYSINESIFGYIVNLYSYSRGKSNTTVT